MRGELATGTVDCGLIDSQGHHLYYHPTLFLERIGVLQEYRLASIVDVRPESAHGAC
jgi:hypothetical protein